GGERSLAPAFLPARPSLLAATALIAGNMVPLSRPRLWSQRGESQPPVSAVIQDKDHRPTEWLASAGCRLHARIIGLNRHSRPSSDLFPQVSRFVVDCRR